MKKNITWVVEIYGIFWHKMGEKKRVSFILETRFILFVCIVYYTVAS